jgi:hypothetical protein
MQIHLAMQFAEALTKFGPKEEIAAALVLQFKDEEFYGWGAADVLDAAERLEVELSIDEAREIVAEIVDDQICSPNYGISDSIIEAKVEQLAEERGDFDKQDEEEDDDAE